MWSTNILGIQSLYGIVHTYRTSRSLKRKQIIFVIDTGTVNAVNTATLTQRLYLHREVEEKHSLFLRKPLYRANE